MKLNRSLAVLCTLTMLTACQPSDGTAPTQGESGQRKVGNFFEQLGDAVKQGVQQGMDNGIETSGAVEVIGYTITPSKLTKRNEPAYCLANPVTHKVITVSPMFGRPYVRPDGTTGFAQTSVQRSEHTQNVEVNLNGVLPGQNCADLISSGRLTPGIAPGYYYSAY